MTDSHAAFAFPGQGSQRTGMLEELPDVEDLGRLLDAAEALSGLDLRSLTMLGPDSELADTRAAQPALYLADWAWGVTLLDCGVTPAVVAGHSLGEFAALAVAGVFSVEAGLELVVERSKLMAASAQQAPGGMAAVMGLDAGAVADAIADVADVWLANDNCPGQLVISGTSDGIAAATGRLTEAGARRVIPLAVSGAFHSPLMQPAADAFSELLEGTEFADARVPVIQNSHPAPATEAGVIRRRLGEQMVAPVRWTETMAAMLEGGVTVMVECGPGEVLSGLARRADGLSAYAVSTAGLEKICEEVL